MLQREVTSATLGHLGFTALVFIASAYPFVLPWVHLVFFAVFVPIRAFDFLCRGNPKGYNRLFLLDFCYVVNALVALWWLAYQYQLRWDAADLVHLEGERFSKRKFLKKLLKRFVTMDRVGLVLYALSDGPVAMATLPWKNSWVWHSQEHIISVLIHLLPGLAMFSWSHLPRIEWSSLKACSHLLKAPETALHFGYCASMDSTGGSARTYREDDIIWLIVVPMLVYAAWQVSYLVLVEVLLAGYVRRRNLDSSFLCLRRREQRKGDASIWNRVVFRGSRMRQVLAFAGVQALYTFASLLVFTLTYYVWAAALAWQVLKFVVPLHFGAQYTYGRMVEQKVRSRLAANTYSLVEGDAVDDGGGRKHGTEKDACRIGRDDGQIDDDDGEGEG